jgi:carbonic anhydrase
MSPAARRMTLSIGIVIALGFLFLQRTDGDEKTTAAGPSADAALKMLQDGNARYVAGKLEHPHQSAQRRAEVAQGQKPFAVVLACADSRVGPEVVFDAGLGDLFVVRVAGNIADDAVLGSIEYAVEHLGSPLIVVCGHERCGAVKATVDAAASKDKAPGHLGALIDPIMPAVKSEKPGDDLLDRAIDGNVRNVVAKINADETIAHLVHEGKVKVVGGRYDLDSGEFKLVEAKQAGAKPSDELMHVAKSR